MQPDEYVIQVYQSENGKSPFEDWIYRLRDKTTRARIFQRIDRVRLGNFGDCRSLGSGLYELKIAWGPGYRVYYGFVGNRIVLLLCGGDKSSQKQDIRKANQLWEEYKANAR